MLRFIISGPSCSGKTTLVSHYLFKYSKYLEENGYFFSVAKSYTTRPKRSDNDNEYVFVYEDEFENLIQNNFFFEHEKIFGNYYGIPKNQIERENMFYIIDVNGREKFNNIFPDALSIMIVPPNYHLLEKRMKDRDNASERINRAILEMERADDFNFVITNDIIDDAADILHNIINAKIHTYKTLHLIKGKRFYD